MSDPQIYQVLVSGPADTAQRASDLLASQWQVTRLEIVADEAYITLEGVEDINAPAALLADLGWRHRQHGVTIGTAKTWAELQSDQQGPN